MAAMKTLSVVLLGVCLFVGVVHGVPVDQQNSAWQFSVDGNAPVDNKQGGHLVNPDFQYSFEQYDAGVDRNANQFAQDSFANLPDASEGSYNLYDANTYSDSQQGSSFGDQGYVYNARSQDNASPYDYNNQFSTQPNDSPSTSYALGVPQERGANSQEYVYDASAGSFADEAVTASDATANPGGASFAAQGTPPADQAVVTKGHEGPASFYTPASPADGAFHFYDARTDDEKKATSVPDENPPSGAASLAKQHEESTDTAYASTSTVLPATEAPKGTHGCPNSYWAQHLAQWPKELNKYTPVCKAFVGPNLKKSLEIVFGTTTVFQALLDTREDPFSKLLRHSVAALLNSYTKSKFPHKPEEVSKLFHAALASKTAAAAQAQKFENENHAFGDSECK